MRCPQSLLLGILSAGLACGHGAGPARAAETGDPTLAEIKAQNQALQQQVQKQQQEIDELRQRLDALAAPVARPEPAPRPVAPEPAGPVRLESTALRAAREIRVSGEVGLGYFKSGPDGTSPNGEFRVDDARVFLEAPVWKNAYFFTGLELMTRETGDGNLHFGELYADFEDLLTGSRDERLSLRIGRFNVPFGEEYQVRSVMTDPLIMHSVADIWGIDNGLEIYGTLGRFQYNLAVQNGGQNSLTHDYNQDKSVTARLSLEPVKGLHLSGSFHRTGKLDAKNDFFSNIWFGGGFFGALGPAATTRTFQATLYEFDAAWQWATGRAQATAGTAQFSDDNPAADDSRRLQYGGLEVVQQVNEKFYAAARYSEVRAAEGYPLVGLGDFGEYYFGSPTVRLHRLSLGLGYRFAEALTWKIEYSLENGRLINGATRGGENMFSTEVGLKF